MVSSPNNTPLKELKYEAVPGYRAAFLIAFAGMGIYLAAILISSPGSAKEYHKKAPSADETKPTTDK